MGLLKKITKPISKVLDKIVPNEVKPFLPYLAAVAPYMLPPGAGGIFGSIGIQNPMLQRALLTGTLNLGSQLAQEGSEGDFSGMSLGLAGLQGALTAPGAADYFKGKQVLENYNPELAGLGQGQAAVGEQLSMLDKAKNIGLGTLEKGAQYASGISKTLQDPFGGTLTEFGKAASVPFIQGSTDLAMSTARRALKDYEDELAAFNEQAGATTEASNLARRNAIISSMTAAAFDEDTIDDTLAQLGLRNGGRVGAMNGGIMTAKRGLVNAPGGYAGEEEMDRGGGISIGIGKLYPKMLKQRAGEVVDFLSPSNIKDMPKDFSNFLKKSFNDPEGPYQKIKQDIIKSKNKKSSSDEGFGGIEKAVESVEQKPKTFLVDKLKVTVNPGESQEKATLNAIFNDVDDVMPQDRKEEFYRLLIPKLKNTGEISDNEYKMLMQEVFSKAKGGIISLNMGGSVLPKGIEMDLRGGGFIPMGSMEKADDVPARVSKNEFVMTADAVRAAGGGSINKGAQRMYQLMNNLEARV
jgi:hypothetical protein